MHAITFYFQETTHLGYPSPCDWRLDPKDDPFSSTLGTSPYLQMRLAPYSAPSIEILE